MKSNKYFNIEFMYSDGICGRDYYILINNVKINVCSNNGDNTEAKEKTLNILNSLKIKYNKEIEFKHDGWI